MFTTFEVFRNHVYGFHTDIETVQTLNFHTTNDDENHDHPVNENLNNRKIHHNPEKRLQLTTVERYNRLYSGFND